jgi:uroporphyrinogen decarboxylase
MTAEPGFAGLRVAAFESRRAEEMARLIERHGGVPFVSPSMREVPLQENPEAITLAHRLLAGEIDVVVLLTGVGTRHWLAQVERHVGRQRFIDALADVITVVRGPKPAAVLKEWGLEPTHRVPEPNTWRELLRTLDQHVPLANLTVAVQEYGQPNLSLLANLEARGARVLPLKVYAWDLPEDTSRLQENLRAVAGGQREVALFTSAHQVVNVLRMSEQLGLSAELLPRFQRLVVASIGPTTSEMLRECGLPVDIEPDHPKMGQLVAAAAAHAQALLAEKRGPQPSVAQEGPPEPLHASPRLQSGTPGHAAAPPQTAAAPQTGVPRGPAASLLVRACRGQATDRTPIWLMRQAGRYLPEYREVRARVGFLELCKNPQLCADVMISAVKRLGVDAAIIFADLLPMLEPMGAQLEYQSGEGPVIHNPIRTAADVARLRELQGPELPFVYETVRLTRAGLPHEIAVIGFAGAPFTLASYLIEGGGSRHYTHTKRLMYSDPPAWHALLGCLARSISRYLLEQVRAGADVVQLFDSWVGCLGPEDYRRYVLPHTRYVIESLEPHVPTISFFTGNPALIAAVAEAGGSVVGVDWRIRLDDAWRQLQPGRGIQGNLDPAVLLASPEVVRRGAQEILRQAAGRPGHVFNLGHGVLPETPPENVRLLVETVKEFSARR